MYICTQCYKLRLLPAMGKEERVLSAQEDQLDLYDHSVPEVVCGFCGHSSLRMIRIEEEKSLGRPRVSIFLWSCPNFPCC